MASVNQDGMKMFEEGSQIFGVQPREPYIIHSTTDEYKVFVDVEINENKRSVILGTIFNRDLATAFASLIRDLRLF